MMFAIFGKILAFALSAAWGLTKIVLNLFFFPILFIVLALSGFIYIAVIALAIYGIYMLVRTRSR
jgi:hypothetical protein